MANGSGNPVALVIDDEEPVRTMLRRILESIGLDVVEAEDGTRWSDVLGDIRPDLAIVDLFMPGQDGLETIGQVRGRWPSIPILAISGSVPVASKSALAAAAHLGADRVLMKPFGPAELTAVIGELGFPVG